MLTKPDCVGKICWRLNDPVTASAESFILTFDDQEYEINALPDQAKELVTAMQLANQQITLAQHGLQLMEIGRQTLTESLREQLKGVEPMEKSDDEKAA